jgi:hypothetical protein
VPHSVPTPCPRCAAPTVEIRLMAGEVGLTMRSCSRCDHRVWLRQGRPADVSDVLTDVASTGRRRSA